MSDYLNKIKKVQPYNINDTIQLKHQLICDENTILGLPPQLPSKSTRFNYINVLNTIPTVFITNNKNELIEKVITLNDKLLNEVYFVDLDIYKYQRNFRGASVDLIMEL